jgi:hypothetical protein
VEKRLRAEHALARASQISSAAAAATIANTSTTPIVHSNNNNSTQQRDSKSSRRRDRNNGTTSSNSNSNSNSNGSVSPTTVLSTPKCSTCQSSQSLSCIEEKERDSLTTQLHAAITAKNHSDQLLAQANGVINKLKLSQVTTANETNASSTSLSSSTTTPKATTAMTTVTATAMSNDANSDIITDRRSLRELNQLRSSLQRGIHSLPPSRSSHLTMIDYMY